MASSLVFKARRSEAVLVQPARPTPIEVKSLSDWDITSIIHHPVPAIMFYKHSEAAMDKDPAEMIKKALAEALVYYYPWAGRLKEGPDGKLVVDCTAEGVVFVEADAGVRLDQFGEDSLRPPFPWADEFFYTSSKDPVAVVNTTAPLGSPIFVMQVTRLLCGGFVLAFTFNHVISDAPGAAMFLSAVTEFVGGALAPTILPVWQRELLNARDPPQVHPNSCSSTTSNSNNNGVVSTTSEMPLPFPESNNVDDGVYRSFFFGPREVAAIRANIPKHLQDSCTSFELIVACVLYCRVSMFKHALDEQVRVVFPFNCRKNLSIPTGYYGNINFYAIFVCNMQDLHDLGVALEKVQKAKKAMTQDYAQAMLDEQVIRRRTNAPFFPDALTAYDFNDWSRVGFSTLDFTPWGKPVFVGRPYDRFRRNTNSMTSFTNKKGEEGRLLHLYMSKDALDRFSIALQTLLGSN